MAAARLAAALGGARESVGVGACARCGVGGARGGGALGLRVRGSLVEERSRLASPEGVEPRLGVRRGARSRLPPRIARSRGHPRIKRARHDARAGSVAAAGTGSAPPRARHDGSNTLVRARGRRSRETRGEARARTPMARGEARADGETPTRTRRRSRSRGGKPCRKGSTRARVLDARIHPRISSDRVARSLAAAPGRKRC